MQTLSWSLVVILWIMWIILLFQTYRLELSLVPVEEAPQKEHMIHPNLLSVNIKEQNRIKFKSDLTSAQAWKVVLWIKNGDVMYQDPVTGTLYNIDKLFEGNKILLGKKKIWRLREFLIKHCVYSR